MSTRLVHTPRVSTHPRWDWQKSPPTQHRPHGMSSEPIRAARETEERATSSPSLVVVLNCYDIACVRSFGIEACGSFRSTLSEQIPALVQMLFNLTHPLALGIGGDTLSFLPEELVLLMHQFVYALSKVLIFHSLPYQSTEIPNYRLQGVIRAAGWSRGRGSPSPGPPHARRPPSTEGWGACSATYVRCLQADLRPQIRLISVCQNLRFFSCFAQGRPLVRASGIAPPRPGG